MTVCAYCCGPIPGPARPVTRPLSDFDTVMNARLESREAARLALAVVLDLLRGQ